MTLNLEDLYSLRSLVDERATEALWPPFVERMTLLSEALEKEIEEEIERLKTDETK